MASVLFLARGLLSGLITKETVSALAAPRCLETEEVAAVSRLIGSSVGANQTVRAKGEKGGGVRGGGEGEGSVWII